MDKEQDIEKIVEALRAAEMRQGCTDYHFYAEKLYQDLFPKPSTANRKLDPPPRFDEVYYQGLKNMNEGESTANREAVRDILQEVSLQERQEGKYYCGLDEKYVDQILSLWPKALSDERDYPNSGEGIYKCP